MKIPLGTTYLLSLSGLVDLGDKESLIVYLSDKEQVPEDQIRNYLENKETFLLVNLPLYIPEQGVLTNKLQHYAPFCLLKEYKREARKYLVISPKVADEIINDFWSDPENYLEG